MSVADFEKISSDLSQQWQDIQSRLKDTQKIGIESAKDLLQSLEKIRNDIEECQSNTAGVDSVNIDAMHNQLSLTKQTESEKSNEEIRNAKNKLDASNKKINELEVKLQECIQNGSRTTLMGPQQLEKIQKLEQQRIASAAEAQVLRKERDNLLIRLEKLSSTVSRIAELRKKCANQGKSLADEIGQTTALQLNDLESKQKSTIIEHQSKLENMEVKLKTIEENLADAYEQECLLRDEQQKAQEQKKLETSLQLSLQKELEEEQKRLAIVNSNLVKCEAQQKIVNETLNETQTELQKLKLQFEELRRVNQTRKASEETLQQQVKELNQENQSLIEKNTQLQNNAAKRSESNQQIQEKTYLEEELQQLRVENASLRDQIIATKRQIANLEAKEKVERNDNADFVEQIRSLNEQVQQLRAENLANDKKNEEQLAELAKLQKELTISKEEAALAAEIGQRLLNQFTANTRE